MGRPYRTLDREQRIETAKVKGSRFIATGFPFTGEASLADRVRAGELDPSDIDDAVLEDSLFTRGLPNPDLLIRTSGEHRISNFMLWQLAYTELHISPVFWPEFDREHLFEAVLDYQRRERRFGRVSAGVEAS